MFFRSPWGITHKAIFLVDNVRAVFAFQAYDDTTGKITKRFGKLTVGINAIFQIFKLPSDHIFTKPRALFAYC